MIDSEQLQGEPEVIEKLFNATAVFFEPPIDVEVVCMHTYMNLWYKVHACMNLWYQVHACMNLWYQVR